jgi:SOS-response transcriptional repressor LexA
MSAPIPTFENEYQHHDPKTTYDFIVKYKQQNGGSSPSYREMMIGVGITSSSHMQNIIRRLVHRKWIVWHSTRNIEIVGANWYPPITPPALPA